MIKYQNQEIRIFLDGILTLEGEKYDSLIEIREIIFRIFPNTIEKIMYGGIVFFLDSEMFGGLFVSKNHVTLEFSKGFLMEDPNLHLEGKGKFRRHLKITKREDVLRKEVISFVKQAVVN